MNIKKTTDKIHALTAAVKGEVKAREAKLEIHGANTNNLIARAREEFQKLITLIETRHAKKAIALHKGICEAKDCLESLNGLANTRVEPSVASGSDVLQVKPE